MKNILFAVFIATFFYGCSVLFHDSRMIIEKDIVRQSIRIKKEYYYRQPIERRTNVNYVNQIILKEISYISDVSYTFFDVISLTADAFDVKNRVYLIIDDVIMPIDIQFKESILIDDIRKEEASVSTSDSTEMTVVTGYTQLHNRIIKMRYIVPSDVMNKVLDCNVLKFRYYSGSDMITVKLQRGRLKKLKKMILFN